MISDEVIAAVLLALYVADCPDKPFDIPASDDTIQAAAKLLPFAE